MVHLKIYIQPTFEEKHAVETRFIYIVVDAEYIAEAYEQVKKVCKIHYHRDIPSRPSVPRGKKGVLAVEVKISNDPWKVREWYDWFNVELLNKLEQVGWNLQLGNDVFDRNGLIFKKIAIEKTEPLSLDEVLAKTRKRKRRI